jgi:aryl-alcohol dehydrogenase-like predicted oxidoreductase
MTNFTKRLLGASGTESSALAWGMWRFKGADLKSADGLVRAALDHGFSLLDTADIHGPDNGEAFCARHQGRYRPRRAL